MWKCVLGLRGFPELFFFFFLRGGCRSAGVHVALVFVEQVDHVDVDHGVRFSRGDGWSLAAVGTMLNQIFALVLRTKSCGTIQSLGLLGDSPVTLLVLVGGPDASIRCEHHDDALKLVGIGWVEPVFDVFPQHGVELHPLLPYARSEVNGVLDHVSRNAALGGPLA